MIYLIITTSINNRYGSLDATERKERYLYAISESLKHLPEQIKPIIVENNGKRNTYLDVFNVMYTENNRYQFKSKGINELLDIKEVIKKYNIQDDDIIIKLTGRYRVLSPQFFEYVIENKNNYDAFVKFYGADSLMFDKYDCILGCYAIRACFLKLFNHLTIDNYKFAEIAFARYVRLCGARLKEVEQLDIECSFSDNLRKLIV